MKLFVDKTYNSKKIKEINSKMHTYLAARKLDFHVREFPADLGGGVQVQIVRKGDLFYPENVKFFYRTYKSFKADDAYNSILRLFAGLMEKFGFDPELSRGDGWRIERAETGFCVG